MRAIRHWLTTAITLAGIILLSALGGAYYYYRLQTNQYQAVLQQENQKLKQQKQTLQKMIDRLSNTTRLAQIVVTAQSPNTTTLLIAEVNDNNDNSPDKNKILSQRSVTIPGHIAFFDGLVVKFDRNSVAQGDPFRGKSIALLRRIYSEKQAPQDGFILDKTGDIPTPYQLDDNKIPTPESKNNNTKTNTPRSFEKRIWSRFWAIANDPELAKQLGVRVAQGEAVYKPMKPGILYELTIDAAGGLNLETKPLPHAVADVLAAATQSDH